jgi:hypothetical protein
MQPSDIPGKSVEGGGNPLFGSRDSGFLLVGKSRRQSVPYPAADRTTSVVGGLSQPAI